MSKRIQSGALALSLALSLLLAIGLAGCDEGETIETLALSLGAVPGQPSAPDSYEAGGGDNTPATASTISIGSTQNRTIWPIGDYDYVAVNLTAGMTYEFQTDRLSPHGDTLMYLYDTNGTTQLLGNDDYGAGFGYGSGIRYTAASTATYYLRVTTLSTDGVTSYRLGARIFVDGDGDLYSNFNDCNDGDSSIRPGYSDLAGNGIDENCVGGDMPSGALPDAAEPDNTPAQAKVLAVETAHEYAILEQAISYGQNVRTISPAGDIDWLRFTVQPYGWHDLYLDYNTTSAQFYLVDSDGVTVLSGPSSFFSAYNSGSTTKTFYIKADGTASGTGAYVFIHTDYGRDLDGDGFYSAYWAGSRDCNDADPAVRPGATDPPGDGIDWNCNGVD